MLDALEVGRINVACRALGILDRVSAVAAGEALGREVGQGVLADHTHAQLRIGEIHVRMLAAESLTLRAAIAVDARVARRVRLDVASWSPGAALVQSRLARSGRRRTWAWCSAVSPMARSTCRRARSEALGASANGFPSAATRNP
jgi:alkylation response protein AidB-like acyl-CoA dehydrogenase